MPCYTCGLIILSDFLVDPGEKVSEVVEGDVTHVGDSEGLLFELAVTVAEDRIMFGLNGLDGLGDIDAASVLDCC